MPTKAELEAALAEKEQQLAEVKQQINGNAEVPEIKPIEYVIPTYTTAVLLPTVVGIPLVVATPNGVLRDFAIESAESPIPRGVYEWLIADSRYAPWFDQDAELKVVTPDESE